MPSRNELHIVRRGGLRGYRHNLFMIHWDMKLLLVLLSRGTAKRYGIVLTCQLAYMG